MGGTFNADQWLRQQPDFDADAWLKSQQAKTPATPATPTAKPTEDPNVYKPKTFTDEPFGNPDWKITNPWFKNPLDFIQGAGAGIASLPGNVTQAVHKYIPAIPTVQTIAPPDTPAGHYGYGTEQALEYIAPTGVAGKLNVAGNIEKGIEASTAIPKYLPVVGKPLAKAVAQAVPAAAIGFEQSRGDTGEAEKQGAIAGGTSLGMSL